MTDVPVHAGDGPPGSSPAVHALGIRNGRLLLVGIAVYAAVLSGLMIVRGVGVTPDVLLVGFGIAALVLGRGRLFFRDWVPFIALFFAYELMRGYADDFGMAVHITDVLAIDRAIGLGRIPTEWLQGWLHPVSGTDWIAVGALVVYFLHFPLPLAVGFLLWLRRRPLYYDFVAALILLCIAGFLTFLFVPVAPPWYAAAHGFLNGPDGKPLILHLQETAFYTLATTFGFNGHYLYTYTFYEVGPNPVAAFPSLHAGFPFLAFLFARRAFGRAGWLVLGFFALVCFSVVYLGEHYVIDVVGGMAYASAAYLAVTHAPGRIRATLDRLRNDALAIPRGVADSRGSRTRRDGVAWRRVALGLACAAIGAVAAAALARTGYAAGSFAYLVPAVMVLGGLSAAAWGLYAQ